MKLLNLGCGNHWHEEWTNVDFYSTSPNVQTYDLRKGIPFDTGTFDVIYHSHVIEHFSKQDAPSFLSECYRVLKPDGILRVAFPDLEQIALNYIRLLKELRNNKQEFSNDYDWIMLELFDQTVRNFSGGEMAKYFIKDLIPNQEFVLQRLGMEAKNLIEWGRHQFHYQEVKKKSVIERLKKKIIELNHEFMVKKLLKNEYNALQIGRFRLGGEIHQWMYDSYSLTQLLNSAGFHDVVIRDAVNSYINNWEQFHLDTEPDGSIYKPDSSYIEGIK
jgi:predicted SAM-dependent methyltransferase